MARDDGREEAVIAAATDRLVDSAAGLGPPPGCRADGSGDRAFQEFVTTYRDWIVAHHDLPGSRAEQVEKTHLLLCTMAAAATLDEAIGLLARFRRLVWGDRGVRAQPDATGAMTLSLEQPVRSGVPGLVSDLWSLSFLLIELEFLAGGPLDGVAGQVRQAACLPAATAGLLFDRPLAYGAAELALFVPARHRSRPVIARADQVPVFLRSLVPKTVGGKRAAPEMAGLVAGIVKADRLGASGMSTSLEGVAARLGFSAATLRRRLGAEGTTFRQIRERTFDELATAWLAQGISIDSIADRLGYSDAFAFRRAFHRRHRCSPTEYRRQRGRPASSAR